MAQPTELTLRLRPELLASLDELARTTRRSRAELAEEALAQYLDVQRWQIEGIQAAIEEADRGDPSTPHERVAEWLDSWGAAMMNCHRRNPADRLANRLARSRP